MTDIKLDRKRPYAEIIGATDGSKYEQDGITFNHQGEAINIPQEEIRRKPGSPPKEVNI